MSQVWSEMIKYYCVTRFYAVDRKVMLVIHVFLASVRNRLSQTDVYILSRGLIQFPRGLRYRSLTRQRSSLKGNVGDTELFVVDISCPPPRGILLSRVPAIKPTTGYSFRGRIRKTSPEQKEELFKFYSSRK